ncbi:unnamed protein product [Ascophyllum nodosum]
MFVSVGVRKASCSRSNCIHETWQAYRVALMLVMAVTLREESVLRAKSYHVCVCVVIPFSLDVRFVEYQPGSHRICHPPSCPGSCLHFSREKDSAIPLPRRA